MKSPQHCFKRFCGGIFATNQEHTRTQELQYITKYLNKSKLFLEYLRSTSNSSRINNYGAPTSVAPVRSSDHSISHNSYVLRRPEFDGPAHYSHVPVTSSRFILNFVGDGRSTVHYNGTEICLDEILFYLLKMRTKTACRLGCE